MSKIGILGAGAWGIALGMNANKNGHDICIWHYDKDKASLLNKNRKTSSLKEINIPKEINFVSNLRELIGSDILIYASPTQSFDGITREIKEINNLKMP